MSEPVIKAYQGQPFTVVLRGASGTNWGWCLTTLPAGVALATIQYTRVAEEPEREGAPVDATFSFFAIGSGRVRIGFKYLPWNDPEHSVEEQYYEVLMIPHDKGNAFGDFVACNGNGTAYNVPPYGYNAAGVAAIIPYGVYNAAPSNVYGVNSIPPIVAYGYHPNCQAAQAVYYYGYACRESAAPTKDYGNPKCATGNTAQCPPLKYGYPGCAPSNMAASPAFEYGYPGCLPSNTAQCPPLKYGYPGCAPSNMAASPAFEYGYPGCAPSNTAQCPPLKYGYPGCAPSNMAASPAFEYGYPGCQPSNTAQCPPLKYGYPGCAPSNVSASPVFDYGYPNCAPVKYGFPGCR